MFELRNYQSDALGALWRYWRDGGGNPLIDLATGLGKSFILAELARRFCQHDRRVIALSHVREIIEQDCKAIQTLWPEAPLGINCAALGERNVEAPLVLATVHSIYRDPQALGSRDLIILDEAHLVPHGDEGMYRTTIAALRELKPTMRVVGLTATPYRLDSGRLDQGDGRLFDRVVFRFGIGEGVRDGWLAPLIAKGTEAEIDVGGVALRDGEFVAGELEAAADQSALVEAAVSEIVAHGAGSWHAWLAFCCGVEHARHVRDALRRHDVGAETISGDTPAEERAQTIAAFRAGRITCLTGCNVFTTGFDVAAVDLIAMLRPTWSPGLYVQMAGRGTRRAAGKQNCLLLDFAGNVMRHGPVDTVTGEAGDTRDYGDGDGARAKCCPDCHALVAPVTRTCPECGYAWPQPSARHDVRASTLAPLSSSATWLRVLDIDASEHVKPDRPPSLRVDFYTRGQMVSEWLAFEHGEGARWHATKKWRALGGREPVPTSVRAALARAHELEAVTAIAVRRDGEFWRVVDVMRQPELLPRMARRAS